jgi:excisionase family DNA binding protein
MCILRLQHDYRRKSHKHTFGAGMEGSIIDGDGLELWSAETLGRRTGLGKRRIYKLAAEFGLPAVRVGGRMWFRPQDVDAYFAERTGAGEAA